METLEGGGTEVMAKKQTYAEKMAASRRRSLIRSLAERKGMTLEEWTRHLQDQELLRMKVDEPEEYQEALELLFFGAPLEAAEEAQEEEAPPAVEKKAAGAPRPRKACSACGEEKGHTAYAAGKNICRRCESAQARNVSPPPSPSDVPMSPESAAARERILARKAETEVVTPGLRRMEVAG